VKRLPIRTRLTLAFAGAMALVLGATGVFVYERQRSDLDEQIHRELDARLAGVVAIIVDDGDDLGDPEQDPLERVDDEGYVQVLDANGDVADATTEALLAAPLIDGSTLDSLVRGDTPSVDVTPRGIEGDIRLTAARTRDDGRPYFAIVGASLDQRDETLASLSRILLIGGPIALILGSLLAYLIISAALRPVESMRARAASISAGSPGQRLPVPEARDEIASLGETLNEMLERMEAAFQRERSFVSDASHELRTPLTILKAELDLALAKGRSQDELVEAIRSASDETNRLVKLADELLVLARADEGRLPLNIETIATDSLMGRVATRFASRAEDAGSSIQAEPAGNLSVEADSLRLEQALSNMVENALRYGQGPVTLKAVSNNGWVEIHVHDSGDGFPDGLLDRAFERFTRADTSSERGGSGLGLAIVAAIADAHGGTAHLSNGASGGADAWIRLPASRL